MPESLFAPRRFRRSYLVYCTLGAMVLEGSLVGIAAIWPQNKTIEIPPVITEVVDLPSDPVRELILPNEDPIPTPEEPTPPPDETPPPDDTPPPDMEPEMTLDTPKPTPSPGPPKKPAFVRPPGTPDPRAKRGPVPQNGVVGGVPSAARTAGPLPVKNGGGWSHPQPAYPYQARAAHITGSTTVKVTSDGSGHVANVEILRSAGNAILDNATTSFAKANWKGPPNSSTTVVFEYRFPN